MSFVDVPDVFIGATEDAHTFVVLNRPVPDANRLLTDAGFTTHKVNGRTIYLLPPTTAEEANEQAGTAMYGLLAHTHDLVDLSSTTQCSPHATEPEPDVRFTLTDTTLTATAITAEARSLLEQHGLTPSGHGTSYQPATPLNTADLLYAVVRAEAHAHALGITVRVELGIPTPDAIPVPSDPATGPAQRRTRCPDTTPVPRSPASASATAPGTERRH
ncbi:hypothetical protein [Streptomyces shenzhenensis]|uniref:hypothetical protein n=1 Tax=Streptomyces shenzhenensis TaxID=943815 RepID=UPI001604C6EA|nr:hypothetical protein [Streptomyces shenzhenensis]